MFQFPRFPLTPYVFRCEYLGMTPGGFPHSGIPGSKLARQLTGAYRSHATPFIGLWRQGIHQVPLVACSDRALARLKILSTLHVRRRACVGPHYSVVNVLLGHSLLGKLDLPQRSTVKPGQRNRLDNPSSRLPKPLSYYRAILFN
jgi:hypothetical protein